MFVRVLISVDGPYAPTPISGSVACELLRPEKVVGLSLVGEVRQGMRWVPGRVSWQRR